MDRVWLVTGGNSGFGRAIAEAAVAAGDVVVATARRVTTLDDLVAAHPDQVEAATLDVTDLGGIEATVRDVVRRHGRIDVLVNNAGRSHVGAVEETTDAGRVPHRPVRQPQFQRTDHGLHGHRGADAGDGTDRRRQAAGDAAKAAALILAALDDEKTPLRLPLGDDAVDAVLGHLDGVHANITAWESRARDTRLTL